MTKFKVLCESPIDGSQIHVLYDTSDSSLTYEDGRSVIESASKEHKDAVVFSPAMPAKKTAAVKILKIQLGLSCNYECTYCSQRFVPRSEETNPDNIEDFLAMVDANLKLGDGSGVRVEFWGGEPFVYWKTLKPLAELIRSKFPQAQLSIVTNGSLLNDEKVDWLYNMRFVVGISHDGPNMKYRGPDPLEDPVVASAIRRAFRMIGPANGAGISFNAMLHAGNMRRAPIIKYFKDFLGVDGLAIGEGGVVDAYDADGAAISLNTKALRFEFRRIALEEMMSEDMSMWTVIGNKLAGFEDSLRTRRPLTSVAQKCGMDRDDSLAVDLRGNVLTCQNVSAVSQNPAGDSHNIGHINDIGLIGLNTATHLLKRASCPTCPVAHICAGSCMFLSGQLWDVSCNNAYTENIVYFAYAIYRLTGYIPVFIDADHLPDDRKDIFGSMMEHKEAKQFPIPVVAA